MSYDGAARLGTPVCLHKTHIVQGLIACTRCAFALGICTHWLLGSLVSVQFELSVNSYSDMRSQPVTSYREISVNDESQIPDDSRCRH